MTDTASEEWRAICEARDWLRKGYTTSDRVGALMARVTAERGEEAAKRLRDEMRRQWASRRDWLGPDL
jgi:hypothetical protein